jgi:hypothetical protein
MSTIAERLKQLEKEQNELKKVRDQFQDRMMMRMLKMATHPKFNLDSNISRRLVQSHSHF